MDSTHPQYLAQNITYTPWGAESTLENGCAGSGCTNTVETYAYNNRLQPVMIELGTTANPAADYYLVYNDYASLGSPGSCAVPSQGTGDNGNVRGYLYQDSVNSSLGHAATYSYDSLNRLTNAAATGSSTYNFTFQYDRWGNMTCTINGQTNGPCPEYSFNSANNRITNTGYTYDAAGDLTSDNQHSYQWDAEGRMASTDGGNSDTIAYNALGQWVYWQTGNYPQYLYDPAGNDIAYYLPSSGWLDVMVPLNDRMLASYPCCAWGTATGFGHVNALGSTTMSSSYDGTPNGDPLFYPWGQAWGQQGLFAGFSDINTLTDDFMGRARPYSYNQGRWLTPDRLGGDITNPQSLNRYAYALNNPTTLTDPTGLDPCTIDGQSAICTTSTAMAPDQPPFYIGPCSYEAIEAAACYGGSSPAPPGWVPFPSSTVSSPPPAPKPNIISWPQLQSLVKANSSFRDPGKSANYCDDVVDCIVFRESHAGFSGGDPRLTVPNGLGAGFFTNHTSGPNGRGARGIMQIEPCGHGGPCVGAYDAFNPAENIWVGSAFLQQKISRFGLWGGVAHYGPLSETDYASHVRDCVTALRAGNAGGAYAAATAH